MFEIEKTKNIELLAKDAQMKQINRQWLLASAKYKYSYNFKWLGIPIIQFPQDIIAMQEIIWDVKPDLIIETGIAHGGSLIFYASLLHILGGNGRIVGIDIDIRNHNRNNIENHPLKKRIKMIEGSSIDKKTVEKVKQFAKGRKNIMVILDSNHTHEHVLAELELYSPFVTPSSFLVVFDTAVDDFDIDYSGRPWGKGNNPKTAVKEFLKNNDNFVIDDIDKKLLITVAPDGYLKRIR